MALTDPQSITINAVANSLPRVGSGPNSGSFQKDDGSVRLSVNHAYGKRNRRTIRVDHNKISTDPLQPNVNRPFSMSAYVVIDTPVGGYTNAEIKQITDGLVAYLSASSGAVVTKILGGES